MNEELNVLASILRAANWRAVEIDQADQRSKLDAIFTCEYAVVGIVMTAKVEQMLATWVENQMALLTFRKTSMISQWKDCYLLYLVDEIKDTSRSAIRNIINDTQGCRKICIERERRQLEDALMDAPFLNVNIWDKAVMEWAPDSDQLPRETGLLRTLMDDLGKKSSKTVLKKLIDGAYSPKEVKNED